MKQSPLGMIPLALTVATLVACTGAPTTEAPAPGPEPTQPAESTTAPATVAPEPITVTDALDREQTFEAPPQRIAIAGRASALLADAIFLFPEAAERIVAVEDRAQNVSNFLGVVDPGYEAKSVLERDAAAEQILPFEPDLVIMKSFMAESLGAPLAELGVPVVYLEMETPSQYWRDLRTLGQLFGNPDRAEELVSYFQDRTERVQQLSAAAAADTLPRILILQYVSEGGEVSVEVPSASWLQTQMAEIVAAEPVWREAAPGGGWSIVGFEQIAAWDPEQIYVVDYFGDSNEAVAVLAADANWSALSAVQEGRIYGFPADYLSWDQPDPRWILGLQWLATKVHPSLRADLDLTGQIQTFFIELYGMEPATYEAEILPQLSGSLD